MQNTSETISMNSKSKLEKKVSPLSVASFLKTSWFITNLIGHSIVMATCSVVSYHFSFWRKKEMRQSTSHKCASLWARGIVSLTPGWKVQVNGQENIPSDGKFVLVANHESATDIFVMYFTGLQFRWLSKASVFKIPFIGQAMHAAGYIPIERGNKQSHVEAFERSKDVVKSGVPMFYFPEGTRSKTGKVKDFKSGAFKLAEETDAKIVPIALSGTKNLLVKGSFVPGYASVFVDILKPITREGNESLDSFTQRARMSIIKQKEIRMKN